MDPRTFYAVIGTIVSGVIWTIVSRVMETILFGFIETIVSRVDNNSAGFNLGA